jgi:hypothetical protein|tara:strand:- start:1071 stop:1235 length:165 start_codon:yes stop_codon:yes gene_type:complete
VNLFKDGGNFSQTARDALNSGLPSNYGIGKVIGIQNVGSAVLRPPGSSLASGKK